VCLDVTKPPPPPPPPPDAAAPDGGQPAGIGVRRHFTQT
jgi:hypothetical protein